MSKMELVKRFERLKPFVERLSHLQSEDDMALFLDEMEKTGQLSENECFSLVYMVKSNSTEKNNKAGQGEKIKSFGRFF